MKKKYVAFCFGGLKYLSQSINSNRSILKKICENFDKLFIINTGNLRFLKQKNNLYNKRDFFINKKNSKLIIKNKKLKLPKNIEFFNPQNVMDFKNFMKDKDIIAINSFGRTFNDLKIHFLFKYFNIKQIQISNIGNLQSQIVPVKKINVSAWYFKALHDLGHKMTVILSNLHLVSKIDIRFISSKETFELLKKNSLFKKLNLFYCKKHILINSSAYDIINSARPIINEKKIVLLDIMFEHEERLAMGSEPKKKLVQDFHKKINKLLSYLSKTYKKKVVICIHPKDNLNKKKKIYSNYKVVKYASKENIFKAFLVFFFDTAAIVDAVFLKKRIFAITSKAMDKNQLSMAIEYHKVVGMPILDLDDKNIFNRKKFLKKVNIKGYSNYIKKNIASDGKNFGYKKIIKIVKNNFF